MVRDIRRETINNLKFHVEDITLQNNIIKDKNKILLNKEEELIQKRKALKQQSDKAVCFKN